MPPRTQLDVATYNLYHLHEPGLAIYRDRDGWSQDEYDKKIAWLGKQLTSIKSDIWGFQELWHEDSLSNLLNSSGIADTHTAIVPSGHSGKIVCAAAVKSDILVGMAFADGANCSERTHALADDGCFPSIFEAQIVGI